MLKGPTVLILTAHYGSGHVQAAKVLAAELKEKGYTPIVSDLFGESYPAFSTITQALLMKSFSYGTQFYKWFYYGTNKLHDKGLTQFSQYLGQKKFLHLVGTYQPAFIITTFPIHVAPYLLKKFNMSIPTFTVITDYCAHPYWINPLIDQYFVSSEKVSQTLQWYGVEKEKVTVSGIPIRREFEQEIDKEMVHKKHFLSTHKKIVTILAGAYGVLRDVKMLCHQLLQNPSLQVVAVCGKNEGLFEKLQPILLKHPKHFRLYPYVEGIHELLSISSCIITKPGGITLTEVSALQAPLILYRPIPGQEEENANYFSEIGAALIAHSHSETMNAVQQIIANEHISQSIKRNLSRIYQQGAAEKIVYMADQYGESFTQLEVKEG
ncbi:diacylglycerol glucosyltransferase [Cytobacillus spongiae]|uniref:MGDG synthase family glycosyltransferase n=1 Tax=Cytobacillus spongiae TaxID=2901381 RepID=UPI001F2ACD83|nr:glycosyltransferase [Cytobacillus spongiae]UII54543.1 diacylglycerol glucosyltransferase [Cytobacillus spongiae]